MKKSLLTLGISTLCASLFSANALALDVKKISPNKDKPAKISASLNALSKYSSIQEQTRLSAKPAGRAGLKAMKKLIKNSGAMMQDELLALDMGAENTDILKQELLAMGATHIESFGHMVSALVPLSQIEKLSNMPSLRFARSSQMRANASAGVVQSQADAALRADLARDRLGVTGAGIRVGVLSDSYGCNPGPFEPGAPSTTAEEDIASGETSADIIVLEDLECVPGSFIDEGRAMMQLINDIAPESALAFHTAFTGQAAFANGIIELARDAGSDVIVDDIIYFAEPMFQDGPIAQAAGMVKDMGVPYFSSAGNNARESYESEFRAVELDNGLIFHDFDPGEDTQLFQTFFLDADGPGTTSGTVSFQWDEPNFSVSGAPGSASDIDLLFFDEDGNELPDCFFDQDPDTGEFPPVCTLDSAIDNLGGDAIEVPTVISSVGSVVLSAAIQVFNGKIPGRIKQVPFNNLFLDFDQIGASTVYGHANGPGVMAVGAAPFDTTPQFGDPDIVGACFPACAEPFSSAGGLEILFDVEGKRLTQPLDRLKPDVTGPDGTNTTFFFFDSFIDDDAFPNFFGTSASAPNVAAIAALMLDASERFPLRVSEGDRQRICLNGRRTILVSDRIADALIESQPNTFKGFCLTPDRVYDVLERTAQDMTSVIFFRDPDGIDVIPDSEGFDYDTGNGYVNGLRAIRQVLDR